MKQKKKLNVGLVGYGFMGRTHSNAFGQVNNFFDVDYEPVLKAVCARNPERLTSFAANWGYESTTTDWRQLVGRKDIDLIDVCNPTHLHPETALKAGKHVLVEKAIALEASDADAMYPMPNHWKWRRQMSTGDCRASRPTAVAIRPELSTK